MLHSWQFRLKVERTHVEDLPLPVNSERVTEGDDSTRRSSTVEPNDKSAARAAYMLHRTP